ISEGHYLEIKEFSSNILALQQNNAALVTSNDNLESEVKKANETLNKMKKMEFTFNYPSGMELTTTAEIKQGDNGYYAQIDITDVKANAALATNFIVEGSTYSLNLKDFDLLARTVRAETGGMVEEANIATANVIFNRISSSNYPNTVFDVIHQPN
ncbi:hypothetical protein GNF66_14875, partial [Clostridium perfringens]|nr:hypothetical protein [Clostridium perfringens]